MQGHAVAQNNLGDCYFNGGGCTENRSEAVKWYRKAAEQGIALAELNKDIELKEKEVSLIQALAAFPAVFAQAGKEYSPSLIANYTYDLVKEYNQFYHEFSILREEDEAKKVFRLVLSQNVAKVIRLGMGLLGIEMPERM